MRPLIPLCISLLVIAILGCRTAQLTAGGSNVKTILSDPSDCQNLGPVVGRGGGQFGGAWISNDDLIEYAMNDALNKAAERGATHLAASSPQLGSAKGGTTTATVLGIAYRCPVNAEPPAPASGAR
jgi:hypothetical protein